MARLADRISNITALGFVHDPVFVKRYLREIRAYVLPYAAEVSGYVPELSDLLENREQLLPQTRPEAIH